VIDRAYSSEEVGCSPTRELCGTARQGHGSLLGGLFPRSRLGALLLLRGLAFLVLVWSMSAAASAAAATVGAASPLAALAALIVNLLETIVVRIGGILALPTVHFTV